MITSAVPPSQVLPTRNPSCCRLCRHEKNMSRINYKCGTQISKYFPLSENNPSPGWYKGTICRHLLEVNPDGTDTGRILNEIHYEDGDYEAIHHDDCMSADIQILWQPNASSLKKLDKKTTIPPPDPVASFSATTGLTQQVKNKATRAKPVRSKKRQKKDDCVAQPTLVSIYPPPSLFDIGTATGINNDNEPVSPSSTESPSSRKSSERKSTKSVRYFEDERDDTDVQEETGNNTTVATSTSSTTTTNEEDKDAENDGEVVGTERADDEAYTTDNDADDEDNEDNDVHPQSSLPNNNDDNLPQVQQQVSVDAVQKVFALCQCNNWKGVLICIQDNPVLGLSKMGNTTVMHLAIASKIGGDYERANVVFDILERTPMAATLKNSHGNLPLHAICNRSVKFQSEIRCQLQVALINAYPGAVVDGGAKGRTPLHIIETTHVSDDVFKLMIKFGRPAVFMRDRNGYLPIHEAVRYRLSKEKIEILLKAYPNSISAKTKDGKTVLDLARETQASNKKRGYKNTAAMNLLNTWPSYCESRGVRISASPEG